MNFRTHNQSLEFRIEENLQLQFIDIENNVYVTDIVP